MAVVHEPEVFKPNFRVWERNPVYLYMLAQVVLTAITAAGVMINPQLAVSIMGVVNILLMLAYGMNVAPLPQVAGAINEALFTPVPQTEVEAEEVRPAVKASVGKAVA